MLDLLVDLKSMNCFHQSRFNLKNGYISLLKNSLAMHNFFLNMTFNHLIHSIHFTFNTSLRKLDKRSVPF